MTQQEPSDSSTNAEVAKKTLAGMFPELVGYFSRRLGNFDDAADAAADTVVELLKRPKRLPEELTELRQYVYGTARHVLIRVRKGRVRHSDLTDQIKQQLQVQEHTVHIPEDRTLADAIGKLGAKDQELLLLIAWEGFGVAEAGALMGLNPNAARKRYSRIRHTLQVELRTHETTPAPFR